MSLVISQNRNSHIDLSRKWILLNAYLAISCLRAVGRGTISDPGVGCERSVAMHRASYQSLLQVQCNEHSLCFGSLWIVVSVCWSLQDFRKKNGTKSNCVFVFKALRSSILSYNLHSTELLKCFWRCFNFEKLWWVRWDHCSETNVLLPHVENPSYENTRVEALSIIRIYPHHQIIIISGFCLYHSEAE